MSDLADRLEALAEKALERLERSTWDSRILPAKADVAVLLTAYHAAMKALDAALDAANELQLSSAHFPREQIIAALRKDQP
jgi:uncharacterized protein